MLDKNVQCTYARTAAPDQQLVLVLNNLTLSGHGNFSVAAEKLRAGGTAEMYVKASPELVLDLHEY